MQIRLFARTGMPLPALPDVAKLRRMKHQLDFEKPIAELQSKLEELKKHPEKHSLGIAFEDEVAIIEKKIEETKRQIFLNLSATESRMQIRLCSRTECRCLPCPTWLS